MSFRNAICQSSFKSYSMVMIFSLLLSACAEPLPQSLEDGKSSNGASGATGSTGSTGSTGGNPAAQPATIVTNLVNKTVVAGQNLSGFCVVATGTSLTYQWFKAGSPISGANSNCLDKTNVQAADAGSYFVRLFTASGGTTATKDSATATLVVNSPAVAAPVISSDLQSMTLTEGNALSGFCVSGTGANLTFQWYKAGSPITGATANCLSKASVDLSDAGSYYVLLIASQNGATAQKQSATATLTVNPKPLPVACTYSMGGSSFNFGVTITETVNCTNVPAGAAVKIYGTKDGAAQATRDITLNNGSWTNPITVNNVALVGSYTRHLEVISNSGVNLFTGTNVSFVVKPPLSCTDSLYPNVSPEYPRQYTLPHDGQKLLYNCTSFVYAGGDSGTYNCGSFETVIAKCNNGVVTKTPTSGNSCLVGSYADGYEVPHGGLALGCSGSDQIVNQCVNGTFVGPEMWAPGGCYSGY